MNTELSANKILSIFTCPDCGTKLRLRSDAEKIIVTCRNCKRRYRLERNNGSYEIATKKEERKEIEWEGEDTAGLFTLVGLVAAGNYAEARKELDRKVVTDERGGVGFKPSKSSKLYAKIGRCSFVLFWIPVFLFVYFKEADSRTSIEVLEKQKEALQTTWHDATISQSTLRLGANNSVFFQFDNYQLKPTAKHKLDALADTLNSRNTVLVYGYADSAGDTDYNQKLSYKRALSVRDYLWRVSSRRLDIRAEGLGETENTSFRNPFDRRVDIFITVADISLTDRLRDSAVAVWVGFIGSLVTILMALAPLVEKTGVCLVRRMILNSTPS